MTTRLTAREMAAGVRTGELSAAELVADALSAAAALDPALHFVDSLAPHSALDPSWLTLVRKLAGAGHRLN